MIKLFICPNCGWVRTVSRRTDVECFRCSWPGMKPVKLDYQRYIDMDDEERLRYVENWMYLHGSIDNSKQ